MSKIEAVSENGRVVETAYVTNFEKAINELSEFKFEPEERNIPDNVTFQFEKGHHEPYWNGVPQTIIRQLNTWEDEGSSLWQMWWDKRAQESTVFFTFGNRSGKNEDESIQILNYLSDNFDIEEASIDPTEMDDLEFKKDHPYLIEDTTHPISRKLSLSKNVHRIISTIKQQIRRKETKLAVLSSSYKHLNLEVLDLGRTWVCTDTFRMNPITVVSFNKLGYPFSLADVKSGNAPLDSLIGIKSQKYIMPNRIGKGLHEKYVDIKKEIAEKRIKDFEEETDLEKIL